MTKIHLRSLCVPFTSVALIGAYFLFCVPLEFESTKWKEGDIDTKNRMADSVGKYVIGLNRNKVIAMLGKPQYERTKYYSSGRPFVLAYYIGERAHDTEADDAYLYILLDRNGNASATDIGLAAGWE